MDQNHIAPESALTEAATDEPASPFNGTPEEEELFWRGVTHGIRCAGREPGHPHMPRDFSLDLTRDGASLGLTSGKLLEAWPVLRGARAAQDSTTNTAAAPTRAARHDGWTHDKERLFLETLAYTGVVADACRASGMSRDAAYAHRRRAGAASSRSAGRRPC